MSRAALTGHKFHSPDMSALEIVEDLKAAVAQFESIEEDLGNEE